MKGAPGIVGEMGLMVSKRCTILFQEFILNIFLLFYNKRGPEETLEMQDLLLREKED